MYRFHRSGRAASFTQFPVVVQWAKEVADYVSTNYPEATVHVFTEQFGATGTIHWHADYDDIATLDRVGNQLATDEAYNALIGKSKGYFIQGSLRDTLLLSV